MIYIFLTFNMLYLITPSKKDTHNRTSWNGFAIELLVKMLENLIGIEGHITTPTKLNI